MPPRGRLRAALAGLVLLAIAGAVVGATLRWRANGRAGAEAANAAPRGLVDLHSAADLRAQFNADGGRTRLVLLLSPT